MAKEYEVAFRLGAELESSFSKSFSEASSDFKKLYLQVQSMHKGNGESKLTKPIRDDLRRTQEEMKNLETSTNSMMGMLKKAGVAAAGFFAFGKIVGVGQDIVNTFADFEQGMANVRALSGASNEELLTLTNTAKELGATTIFSAKEAADGMKFLASAGYTTNQIIAAMPGLLSLSAAAQMDLAQTSEIVTDTMMAFRLSADKSTETADIFAQAQAKSNTNVYQLGEAMKYAGSNANAANMDLVQTSAVLSVLADSGIKGSMAGTSFNAMLRDLKKASEKGKVAVGKTTISLYDQKGAMRDLGSVMKDIEKATAKMTTQQRDAALADIFKEESIRGVNIMLATGSKRYEELEHAIRNSKGAAKEMADIQMDTLKGSLEELGGAIETAKIELGERLAPEIREVADYIADKLPGAVDEFVDHLPETIEHVQTFGKALGVVASIVVANKIGKGIKNTFDTASATIKVATKATRFFGPTIAALSSPVGIAVGAVGLLTLGISEYRRHQEKARQELIHMGDQLDEASKQYQAVADKSKKTKELVKEYEDLSKVIESNVDPTKDLTAEKERLAIVIEQLQELFPDTITQYDIENGKLEEKVGLLNQIVSADEKLAKLKLEKEVSKNSRKLPDLQEEIKSLEKQEKSIASQKDRYDKAISAFKQYTVEYQDLMKLSPSVDRTEKLSELLKKVNEVGSTVGFKLVNQAQLENLEKFTSDLKLLNEKAIDRQITNTEDLDAAEESYEKLYRDQIKLIEANLLSGSTVEEQAKKYKDLSSEEKKRFNVALSAIIELNKQMNLLDTNKVINVETIYRTTGQNTRASLHDPEIRRVSPYKEGGIVDRPTFSMVGEGGNAEVIVPINNKPRSHALLESANRMMGKAQAGGSYNITFEPQIIIQGGGSDVQNQLVQALKQAQDDFERRFKAMIKQHERVRLA